MDSIFNNIYIKCDFEITIANKKPVKSLIN